MTLKEIAELLEVSPSSISIVRAGRPGVGLFTRRRIQLALEENGYSYTPYVEPSAPEPLPDPSMRCVRLLKFSRSALLTERNEGFVDSIIDAIDATVRVKGHALLTSSVTFREYDAFLRNLSKDTSAGMIVIATEMSRDEILRLKCLSIPLVLLDCDHVNLPFHTVTMDNRDLAYRSVEALRDSGEVGYLRSLIRTGNFIQRGNGYREAVRDFDLPEGDDLLFDVTPSLTGAFEDMQRLLDDGRRVPRALFADNDVIAIGAMRALAPRGYRIPEDVRIIGVDNTLLSQAATPTLASSHIPRVALGESAIRMLFDQISSPPGQPMHIHVGSHLILRESSGAPPAAVADRGPGGACGADSPGRTQG